MFINISLVFFLGCLLGLVWYHFGAFWGALGYLLEPVGSFGGLLWSLLVFIWLHRGRIWAYRGGIWVHRGGIWLRQWPRNAKRACPGMIVSDFRSILGVVLDDCWSFLGCLLGCVW